MKDDKQKKRDAIKKTFDLYDQAFVEIPPIAKKLFKAGASDRQLLSWLLDNGYNRAQAMKVISQLNKK